MGFSEHIETELNWIIKSIHTPILSSWTAFVNACTPNCVLSLKCCISGPNLISRFKAVVLQQGKQPVF